MAVLSQFRLSQAVQSEVLLVYNAVPNASKHVLSEVPSDERKHEFGLFRLQTGPQTKWKLLNDSYQCYAQSACAGNRDGALALLERVALRCRGDVRFTAI